MKSKKKLLIAMAAMSVAAIGAGTVSTFAWFQVTNASGSVLQGGADSSVTVDKTDYSIATVDLPISVAIAPVEATPKPLELAHYYSAAPTKTDPIVEVSGSGAGLYSAYYDQNSKLHYKNGPWSNNNNVSRIYEIDITVPDVTYTDTAGQTWNQSQIRTALAGRTVTATMDNGKTFTNCSGIASIDGNKTYYTKSGSVYTKVLDPVLANKASYYTLETSPATRARFLTSTSSSTTIADGENTKAVEIALADINESSASYTAKGYFALYVEGDEDDTALSTITAAFVCSVVDSTSA